VTYYQPPNQQQPQYPQQPQYRQSPEKPKKEGFLRRNGGLLGVGASLATILTLFLTLGQQGGSTTPPDTPTSTSQASTGYSQAVQQSYMSSCEAANGIGNASGCQCLLTWFENNISVQEFQTDLAQQADTGTVPEDATRANAACDGF
jgi:hypothetical protein